ncbi:acid phosphatase/Vanadium-dependent haloperoxidase [Astrocystis sublimbata]|nr:acid phosphatase/Vanadium-dependent haloperoxidase [Astrocystis sublimbata]
MPDDFDMLPPRIKKKKMSVLVILSYAFDWLIMVVVGLIGYFLGNVTPNKRHFSLNDPNISFPVTQRETVNSALLLTFNAGVPIVIILIVALVFVPGRTVPKGTPSSLVWKRKLWELHTGWLGLALSLVAAWIITQGMKNLFGKPRPDLLDRCQPDLANIAKYIVGFQGATGNTTYTGQLVRATICQNKDKAFLDDGFRSYPSGHSSSAAAGLIYLSLFLASKFAITFPFVPRETLATDSGAITAFPSRLHAGQSGATTSLSTANTAYEGVRSQSIAGLDDDASSPLAAPGVAKQIGVHNTAVQAVRTQAAAPPVYLLLLAVLPFFLAVFIASSRWFDFRHHGFDILFGFIIGTITAFFSFRYYHMPIRAGGGWAWGPRSHDKAFWAGLGSWSFASSKTHWIREGHDHQNQNQTWHGGEMAFHQRQYTPAGQSQGQDIEMGGLRSRGTGGTGGAVSPGSKPSIHVRHHDQDSSRTVVSDPDEADNRI